MEDNFNITRHSIDLLDLLNYVYHNVSKEEGQVWENFFDNNEDFNALVNDLLDFCLEQNMTHIAAVFMVKAKSSDVFLAFEQQLNVLQQEKVLNSLDLIEVKVPQTNYTPPQNTPRKTFNSTVAKLLFTVILVINMPFLLTNYNADSLWQSNLLKASSKEKVTATANLTTFELQYLKVDMLDYQPITNHLTVVAMPSTFELRYLINH